MDTIIGGDQGRTIRRHQCSVQGGGGGVKARPGFGEASSSPVSVAVAVFTPLPTVRSSTKQQQLGSTYSGAGCITVRIHNTQDNTPPGMNFRAEGRVHTTKMVAHRSALPSPPCRQNRREKSCKGCFGVSSCVLHRTCFCT